jgi:hypothetical protein
MSNDAIGMDDNRRRHRRYQRRLPVRFGTEVRMAGGIAIDISEEGMRVECSEPFPMNSVLQVFVTFPTHAVRLNARVAWQGAHPGGVPLMGLHFTHPEPLLIQTYAKWLEEVKEMAREEAAGEEAAMGSASEAAGADPAETAPAPEPTGSVKRRLETRQGNSYEVLFDKQPGGWHLTVVQLPQQAGNARPDFDAAFPTYAAADKALREFIRLH